VAPASAPTSRRRGADPRDPASELLLQAVLASLEDDKAEEIVQIDLRGRSEMADYMVICSGRSTRQVASIADKLCERLKQDHGLICKLEGKETADWVLIDAGDVIVHVFRPEVREFYQLEKMWLPGSGPGSAAALATFRPPAPATEG
jgi:ribosome-associated protein